MIKKILLLILFSIIIFETPIYSQQKLTLNNKFNDIPQYQINNTDAILFFTYKYSGISLQNPIAEERAKELEEAIKKGKYFYITFTVQFNCSGYDSENNTFERVVWKNIELNGSKRVFKIKTDDSKTHQEQYGNFDTICRRLFLNMAGIIGMYHQLLFPTYASKEIGEEYLKQDWIDFSVEILFNSFETISSSESPDSRADDPGCALIVPYGVRIQSGDALGIYFFD